MQTNLLEIQKFNMSTFKIHSIETAPENSRPMLEASNRDFGMVPNLHAVMSESPAMLEAYKTIHQIFSKKTAFNADELTVVWQTINVENECHYCVPAHTAIAHSMNVDKGLTEALRNGAPIADNKLQTLRDTTLAIIRSKGNLSQTQMQRFLDAGYTNRNYLDILVGYSQKIMSNYTNHAAQTEVDAPFQPFTWKKEAGAI